MSCLPINITIKPAYDSLNSDRKTAGAVMPAVFKMIYNSVAEEVSALPTRWIS